MKLAVVVRQRQQAAAKQRQQAAAKQRQQQAEVMHFLRSFKICNGIKQQRFQEIGVG